MTRKKRSSANRGRLSVDVGDMKDEIVHGAALLGITVSQITRDAFRAYAKRDDGGVSAHNLSLLLQDLEILAQKYVQYRHDPSDAQAADEFQQALDWVVLYVDSLLRFLPR
ncbi:hypothetical protein [Erythrobacter oryzae]|uniref:hypothetical protein n=1 Tax=Erythrobacter oryzae TaxID=3019556 RepID=UPI002555C32C|nr:hypothetical protein [Erythrobacter sp. COR-2]